MKSLINRFGGYNPFATYVIDLDHCQGQEEIGFEFAVSKHLRILTEYELVKQEHKGREIYHTLEL